MRLHGENHMLISTGTAQPQTPVPQLGEERRFDLRIPMDIAVRALIKGARANYRLVDLSCSGARIERQGGAMPPAIHTMQLHVGRRRPLRMLASVVREVQGMYAVRFLALGDVERLEVAELIDHFLSQQPPQRHAAAA